jgi:hypothetical protein
MMQATSNEHPTKLARVRDLFRADLHVSAKPLPADYMFTAHGKVVAIEMKWSIGDLLDSLQVQGESSGPRLAVEVRKLLSIADVPILLVPQIRCRGDSVVLRDDGAPTGWKYASVKGILTDLMLYGCIVDEWSGDMAQRLAQWYYNLQDENHQWIRQQGRPHFISVDARYTAAVWCLCAFEGVGPVAAEKLLVKFGSVEAISQEDLQSLQKVKGIGPKVAKSVYGGFHHVWN